MAYTEFTLWLVPEEPLRATLANLIGRLAQDLDAVAFEPHVTLFCGRSSDAEASAAAHEIALEFSPIALVAERLACTRQFTKTLFVQFEESAAARRMSEAARERFAAPSAYAFNPHLSLLYKTLTAERAEALRETLVAPRGLYAFDRIRMIETELPIEDKGPVLRWRQVCEVPLAGP